MSLFSQLFRRERDRAKQGAERLEATSQQLAEAKALARAAGHGECRSKPRFEAESDGATLRIYVAVERLNGAE